MSTERPTVRETATVTVSAPVDGTRRRRAPITHRQLVRATTSVTIDPRIMAAAKAALREGERLVLNHDGTVTTTYR